MKAAPAPVTVTAAQIPPYCYRSPGMTAEEGAAAAVRELKINHLCDALALLWELRRAGTTSETSFEAMEGLGNPNKTQQRAIVQVCDMEEG